MTGVLRQGILDPTQARVALNKTPATYELGLSIAPVFSHPAREAKTTGKTPEIVVPPWKRVARYEMSGPGHHTKCSSSSSNVPFGSIDLGRKYSTSSPMR